MSLKYLTALLALAVLSGAPAPAETNTTYAQWYGPNPFPISAPRAPAVFA